MPKLTILSFCLGLLLFGGIVSAIPQYISLQGRLQNSTGDNQNGSFEMDFSIYDAETGGNLLWDENQNVSVVDGLFDVELGNQTALTLAFDKAYWVEVNVSDETMSPRMRVTSSAYAYRANDTDYFAGYPYSHYLNTSSGFGGDVSGSYDSIAVTPNSTTLDCSNITGATSNLCTITDTDTDTFKNASGNYLYNDTSTIYLNETVLNATIDLRDTTIGNCSVDGSCSAIIYDTDEGNLNVNSSGYWDNLDTPSDLNYLINLSEANITDENWLETTQESSLNVNSSDYIDNYDSTDFLLSSNEGNLNVNSSAYWDALNTPSDITTLGTITTGVWQGTAIIDTYISPQLTINSSGSVHWTALNSYPSGCSAGQFVQVINDTLTCASDDDQPDSDAEVPDDITVASSNNISSTAGMKLGTNVKFWFGDDENVSMYYNGTAFIIESN